MSSYLLIAGDVDEQLVETTDGNEMDAITLNITTSQLDSIIRRQRNVVIGFDLQRTLKVVNREHRENMKRVTDDLEIESEFLRHVEKCESELDPIGIRLIGKKKERETKKLQIPAPPINMPRTRKRPILPVENFDFTAIMSRTKTPLKVRVERFMETVKPLRSNEKVDEACLNRATATIKQVSNKLQRRLPKNSAV